MPRKRTSSELDIAELKYRNLVDKRNGFNDEARVFREERDALNLQKRELLDEMKALREKRDFLVNEMRLHKARRNELQAKAKELIAAKKSQRKVLRRGLDGNIHSLQERISELERRQETVAMDLKEENQLLEDLKRSRDGLAELAELYAEQESILQGIKGADEAIDELFRQADLEHQMVVEKYTESHEVHEKYVGLVKEVSHLIAAADKKHEEFLKIRERADHYHRRAMEMREKILSIRRERVAEKREARAFIRDRRKKFKKEEMVREEEKVDEALETLKKGRKITLR
jgi:phosphoserine phosphatase